MRFFFVLLVLTSCSSIEFKEDKVYKASLEKAFLQLEKARLPASSKRYYTKKLLNKSWSKFQVAVFPKIQHEHIKRHIKAKKKMRSGYERPIIYNFKLIKKGPCKNLKRQSNNLFKEYFTDVSKVEKNCFLVEARKKRPKKWGQMVTRLTDNQPLAIRLFFSENYVPFGKEVDHAVSKGFFTYRTSYQKYKKTENFDSGMSLYPISLPNLNLQTNLQAINKVHKNVLRIPKNIFVVSMISKMKRRACTKGYQLDYQDYQGNLIKTDFCDGHPWPSAINTRNYFAILLK
jgi:hypothetical protein